MQTVASFLDASLPIIAPLLTAGVGIAPERVGNLSSLNSLGTVLFLMFGVPILARLGPVRTLQAGAVLAASALSVAATGWWPALIVAALLMGIGYGPSPPAGSRILAATAPPRHRTLIFSIKQAGAPAGAAFAGLTLAPAAATWGWPSGARDQHHRRLHRRNRHQPGAHPARRRARAGPQDHASRRCSARASSPRHS